MNIIVSLGLAWGLTAHAAQFGVEPTVIVVRTPGPACEPHLVTQLKNLGYEASWIPRDLSSEVDRNELLGRIRVATARPEWTWGDAMDVDSSRAMGRLKGALPLAILVQVPGFDAAAAVDATLELSYVSETVLKKYAQLASYWFDGRAETLIKFLNVNGEMDEFARHIRWGLNLVPESAHSKVYDFVAQYVAKQGKRVPLLYQQDQLFYLTHAYAPHELPGRRTDRVAKLWIDVNTYPPLRADGVTAAAYGLRFAGACEWMSSAFLRILFGAEVTNYYAKDELKQYRLVRLKGYLVGVLKGEGDTSMLALRTVVDDVGRAMLVMGGVYQISPVLLQAPTTVDAVTGGPTLHVDRLTVRPLALLLNSSAWIQKNIPMLLDLAGATSARQFRLVLIEAARLGECSLDITRHRYHRRAWARVLKRIDEFRREND